MRTAVAAAGALVAALVCAGCTVKSTEVNPPRAVLVSTIPDAPPLRAGDRVRVHVQRDALGVAGSGPVGLAPDGRNRAAYWLDGGIVMNRPSWLTLELADGRQVLVATDKILFIELLDPPATDPATQPAL